MLNINTKFILLQTGIIAIEEDYEVLPLLESNKFGIRKNHMGISQKGIREIKEPI